MPAVRHAGDTHGMGPDSTRSSFQAATPCRQRGHFAADDRCRLPRRGVEQDCIGRRQLGERPGAPTGLDAAACSEHDRGQGVDDRLAATGGHGHAGTLARRSECERYSPLVSELSGVPL